MHKFAVIFSIVILVIVGKEIAQKSAHGYLRSNKSLSVIAFEDDVIMGNTLPRWGVLCEDANVYGNPHDGFVTLYTLAKGTKVRLHEQSGGEDRSWVMIALANWIKGNTLCGW